MKKYFLLLILFSIFIGVISSNINVLINQSIRLDESQSLWVASKPIVSIMEITAEDVHVPLYSLLLHMWFLFFPVSVTSARIFSFILYSFSIPLLYLLAKEYSDRKVAILTIFLFILSPFILWYSMEVRMYTLFTLISIINSWFFLKFINSNGKSGNRGYLVSSILGLYTHYFFVLLLAAQIVYVVYLKFAKRKNILLHYILLVGLSFAFFLPWIIYFIISGGGKSTQPLIVQPSGFNLFQIYVNFFFGFQPLSIQSILVALWPVATLFVFVLFTTKKKATSNHLMYFLFWAVLPVLAGFAISFIRPVFLSRYFIFVTPALFLLLAWSLIHLTGRVISIGTVIIVFIMFLFLTYQTIASDIPTKENYREISSYLTSNVSARDLVLVTPPFTVYPIEYYYSGKASISSIPEWDRFSKGGIPAYSRKDVDEQIRKLQNNYENMYIVFSYDQGYENDLRDYLDSNYQIIDEFMISDDLYVISYKLRYY